jgi:hypothetical protein
MRRDMELLREILFFVEAQEFGQLTDIRIEGRTDDEVLYHVQLADEAGWLRGAGFDTGGCHASGLTMAGHDYLEAIRNDTVWRRVLQALAKVGPVPLELTKEFAIQQLRGMLKLQQ